MRNNAIVLFLFLSLVFLAACQTKLDIRPLSADEQAQVLVYAEPMADNLMANMRSRDYETFSKDFNPTMHDVLAKSNFEEMMKTFDEKIGGCTERKVSRGDEMNSNFAITYDLTCQKDTGVQMQVIFEPDEPHLIAGLFFTSPKLNQ